MIEKFDDKIDESECIKIQLRVLEYNYNMYKQKAEAAEARLRAIRKINDGKNSVIDALCESDFKYKEMKG